MWIDSHCHLAGKEYDTDREEVFARALAAGVEICVVIGAGDGLEENQAALKLAAAKKEAYATVGIHPHDAGKVDARGDYLQKLKAWGREPKVVAIGEIGLDYHYDHAPREVQKKVFLEQIELAKEMDKPIVIHSREAWADTIAIVKEAGSQPAGGVFHCFGGTLEEAHQALDLGFYISISGIVTFKKAGVLMEVVEKIPLEKMLIETDAPFLSPTPHRGKRNEPAFVALVGEKIAQLKKISPQEAAEIITENTKKLFKIK